MGGSEISEVSSDISEAVEAAVSGLADIHFIKRLERPRADHGDGKTETASPPPFARRLPGTEPSFFQQPSPFGLGAFPGSFNPVTTAHVELMRRAGEQFSLDEIVLLAGISNADKCGYECELEDRVQMLMLALEDVPKTSIAVCKPAFFVDMIESLQAAYSPDIQLHFIMGKDTLARILDPDERYLDKYRRRFATAAEALDYLLSMSRLIVAERTYSGCDRSDKLVGARAHTKTENIVSLDFPLDLAERSATEVRDAIRSGREIQGLVPPRVETYIRKHQLYL